MQLDVCASATYCGVTGWTSLACAGVAIARRPPAISAAVATAAARDPLAGEHEDPILSR
ncbi:hypothetical protein GT755_12655 [Herbidospora sp. NEAU-GS84]|uniref:Uncharacterized protein n=1 Tax=Herbidospora solisilvae TaxID=2696284 RepID=A0A7C9N6U1_9ACTN|nr:hypothetical protein [Herbidospora solisilvae]